MVSTPTNGSRFHARVISGQFHSWRTLFYFFGPGHDRHRREYSRSGTDILVIIAILRLIIQIVRHSIYAGIGKVIPASSVSELQIEAYREVGEYMRLELGLKMLCLCSIAKRNVLLVTACWLLLSRYHDTSTALPLSAGTTLLIQRDHPFATRPSKAITSMDMSRKNPSWVVWKQKISSILSARSSHLSWWFPPL